MAAKISDRKLNHVLITPSRFQVILPIMLVEHGGHPMTKNIYVSHAKRQRAFTKHKVTGTDLPLPSFYLRIYRLPLRGLVEVPLMRFSPPGFDHVSLYLGLCGFQELSQRANLPLFLPVQMV